MWKKLGEFVIKYRVLLLVFLFAATGIMGYYASQVKLSYEFSKAIPTNNPKYRDYLSFRSTFGDDGNLMVIGIQTNEIFSLKNFTAYRTLEQDLKKIKGVEEVMGLSSTVCLVQDSSGNMVPKKIFDSIITPAGLDSSRIVFESLPFYHYLMVNPSTHSYIMALRINNFVRTHSDRI